MGLPPLGLPPAGSRSARTLAGARRHPIALAVGQFAITGLLAVILVGAVGVAVLRRVGNSEAIRNAREVTRLAGDGIVAPGIPTRLARGDAAAIAAVDRTVRTLVLRDPVIRVKIWDASGRILYSDEPALVGDRFQLAPDELFALRTGATKAEVSDLSRPENRFERRDRQLLEVYHGIVTPAGGRLLFEDYLRYSSVAASGRRLWSSFAPALIGGLLVLELAQIPLAWSLARRLRRGQEERERLLHRAVAAEELERQRIARDLHDGVVQNLAGVSYSLAAAAGRMPDGPNAEPTRQLIEDAALQTRRSVRALRSLLVDLYPPDLHRAGLAAALEELLAHAGDPAPATRLDADPALRLPQETETLIFRVAQEALRNVVAHAHARSVEIAVGRQARIARLTVHDDGVGFVARGGSPNGGTGHFGLRIVSELARDAGGELRVSSAPGQGTRVELEVPVG